MNLSAAVERDNMRISKDPRFAVAIFVKTQQALKSQFTSNRTESTLIKFHKSDLMLPNGEWHFWKSNKEEEKSS